MGLRSPPIAQALRRFDPYPEFDNVRVFKGRPETGGRQCYKSAGLIVPRFEMVRDVQIVGGAGFGQREINGAWRGARADEPLIGDGGLRNAEARTNALSYSQNFSQSNWTKLNCTVVGGQPSPDGGNNAYKLNETTLNAAHLIFTSMGGATGPTVLSVFAKAAERTWVRISEDSAGGKIAYVNLETGTAGNVASGLSILSIDAMLDGWWRINISVANKGAAGNIAIGAASSNGVESYAGSLGSGIFVFQADVQSGSFASPPIITTGLPATRTAYSYRETGLSIAPVHYGVARARLVAAAANHDASFPTLLNVRPTTGSAQVLWQVLKSDGSQRFAITGDDGVDTAIDPGVSPVVGDYEVIAWASRSGSLAISRAGGAVQTAAVSSIANPFTRVGYMGDAATAGANTSNAEMDIFATWNGEISNDALQALAARFAA